MSAGVEYFAIRRSGEVMGVKSVFPQLNLINNLPAIPGILAD